jgi:hypothetical protein
VLWASKKKKPNARSALRECIAAETAILYAASTVVCEVERWLPEIAQEHGISSEVWTAEWNSYRSLLRIRDPDPIIVQRHVNPRDPTDAPTLALAEIMSAVGILSRDKDIPGMGGKVVPITFVFALRDYSRKSAVSVSIKIGGYAVGACTLAAITVALKSLQAIWSGIRALPDGVKLALTVLTLLAVLNPKMRAAISDFVKNVLHQFVEKSPAVMEVIAALGRISADNRADAPIFE